MKDIMSSSLISTSIQTTVGEAAKLMIREGVKKLIVTDGGGKLAGLVRITNMVSMEVGLPDELLEVRRRLVRIQVLWRLILLV
jgi:CBS-domain-containing membrane protein